VHYGLILIFNYLFNALQRKKCVAFVCALHRGDAHLINDDFAGFMHGQKLFINAGAANDPHLVVFCGFQMREQVRHGREPMFHVAAAVVAAAVAAAVVAVAAAVVAAAVVAVAAAVVAAAVVAVAAAVVAAAVVAVMGREN